MAKMQCKSREPTEHPALAQSSLWAGMPIARFRCHRTQLQMFGMKRRWELDQNSKTNMIWTVSLPSHKQLKREISLVKGKKAKYIERPFGKFSVSFMFSSRAVNLSTSTPNSLTRQWKTLTIKRLCTLWGQILLQWLYHIFWTQTLHWWQGKKPPTRGSQGEVRGVPKTQIQTKAEVGSPPGTADWL